MGCIKVGLKPATTNTSISKDHTQVCVCVRVCVCVYLLLPSWSLSRNLHVFLPLYLLTASRRPVRLAPASPRRSGSGSGACAGQLSPLAWVRASVCVSVCVPACGSSALSGRSRAWRGVKGGASVVRRGGAEALRSTAPPWLLLGLGTGQVPGKLGAQVSLRLGPQEVQRPLGRGGWEAAGAEDRHLRGRAGLSSAWDRGEAPLSERGRVWSGRGWEGAETSTPLSPAPRPRAHARTHALPVNGGSWKTLGPRARPGACWSGIGGVRGAGRRQQAGVRSPVLRLKYSTPPDERCGPLARPAGQSEREAKRKALRAPQANRLRLRPYQPEGARSRLISEAKQGRAWLVRILDGRPPGNPGCSRLFAYQKRSFSPRRASRFLDPPRSPSPSRAAGSGWPGPRLPLQTWVASARPASPSAFAFGFQDTRRPAVPSPSGAPLACLRQSRGLHRLKPDPQHPPPPPASQAIAHAHVRAHAQIDVPKRGIYLVQLYCGWIYAWESDC